MFSYIPANVEMSLFRVSLLEDQYQIILYASMCAKCMDEQIDIQIRLLKKT